MIGPPEFVDFQLDHFRVLSRMINFYMASALLHDVNPMASPLNKPREIYIDKDI